MSETAPSQPMKNVPFSLVIASYERAGELRDTLADLIPQTHPATLIVVVDASRDAATEAVCAEFAEKLPLKYERAEVASSAMQRNQGTRHVTTPLVCFMDDDVRLPVDHFEKLCSVFASDTAEKIGGVAGRIIGMQHPEPRGFVRAYYRLQAGYDHPTWGGKVIGPAINFLPSYTEAGGDLIPAEWLNSTCTVYRTEAFLAEKFPRFPGYSHGEDMDLSVRIARKHRLYFHRTAAYQHLDAPSSYKRDVRRMTRERLRNQARIARDTLGRSPLLVAWQMTLHRIFMTLVFIRSRSPGWGDSLVGLWTP